MVTKGIKLIRTIGMFLLVMLFIWIGACSMVLGMAIFDNYYLAALFTVAVELVYLLHAARQVKEIQRSDIDLYKHLVYWYVRTKT